MQGAPREFWTQRSAHGSPSTVAQAAASRAPERVATALDAPTLTEAVAEECLQALALLDAMHTGSVLLLEPPDLVLGRLLREGGFQGQVWVLRSPFTPDDSLLTPRQQADPEEIVDLAELADGAHSKLPPYQSDQPADSLNAIQRNAFGSVDLTVVNDWLSAAKQGDSLMMPQDQRFQVVIATGLTLVLSDERLSAPLLWLSHILTPEGFLVLAEPAVEFARESLERQLLSGGFVAAADARRVESEQWWQIVRWQYRPSDLGRLPGVLTRISKSDLDASAALRQMVVASYRDVFGGDEWSEWMLCGACGRQYSRREYEELLPPDQCVCGAVRSLNAFHAPEHVLGELGRDLADDDGSRLYVCMGTTNEVDAFIWGYLATARQIAETLLPRQGEGERQLLTDRLRDRLTQLGVEDPESALIYHQAYIGSVKQARSFSLPRVLFARMCQFALDRSVQLVVTATIPSVNAYALLRGIGMDVIYTYPTPLPIATARDVREVPDDPLAIPYSRLDETGVIVGGAVREVLATLTSKSDRGLVKAVGTFLRQERGAANEAPA